MTALALHDEFRAMRARFHRALAISVLAHVLLAAGLMMAQRARPVLPRIIEVTWLEPVAEAAVAPVPPPADLPREEPAAARVRSAEAAPALPSRPAVDRQRPAAAERRQAQLAELAASRPALSSGLDVAPASTAARRLMTAAPTGGSDLTRLASGVMLPVAAKGRPVDLTRGPDVKSSALALTRGPSVSGGGLALAAAASVGGAGGSGSAAVQSPADGRTDPTAPGELLLDGPAADRPVVASRLPEYPDWARRQAVEAAVTLHFTVLPDGRVREDVQVLRTGGFRDFDERAVAALRQWRFAALTGGDAGGQWGTITFRFRLRG